MTAPAGGGDALWYKDAIIYELHVRAFADGNDDGIGDFRGLLGKLDYLRDLGVTCIWILPFFPSPLRDDGYDIMDYENVNPAYGTLDDFRAFLAAAHERNMRVMIELVINHTSDQHPWFQAARSAPPGSPEREFYVWSDTDAKYKDVRIIFTDTEKSNWTWDEKAKAYFWHRFFSHQPDLNFDNPAVVAEVVRIMRYWLDMGVDALRLDAIPYLVERDGTNCENLPETHAAIKRLRAALEESHPGRMLLAEANQWPRDVRAYFGDGDECHMAFHFPLMPRLFMALRLEDRHPVVDIMAQTPEIPESCQWGLFLRNHDELTLEMVSDDERAYMYFAFGADPRMRVNVGIRRRLAPLLENNRRRIELLFGILLSFPGTPIMYYGDEIGMGDNIYLGDRNGVRTPMQWSADRNGGFSRALPQRLYSPLILDPVYGYEAINVEAQQGDPSSLLNWTRNLIDLRKLFRVFGRGSVEFLKPANQKVLAYVRRHESETILCVANLSRFAQPCELDLSAFAGLTPVEMLGFTEFPKVRRTPYALTLGPYGFLWFELQGELEPAEPTPPPAVSGEVPALPVAATSWAAMSAPAARTFLESRVLPSYLRAQRWFGGKARKIRACRIADAIELTSSSGICLVEVVFESGTETYVVPLGIAEGAEAAAIIERFPATIVCPVLGSDGVVYDALASDESCRAVLALVKDAERRGLKGALRGNSSDDWKAAVPPEGGWRVARIGVEQSNTSIVFGDEVILKLFRRLTPGEHPDAEMTRYLTEEQGFAHVPPYAGDVAYVPAKGEAAHVLLLQRFVQNQGDGWKWMQDELGRYFERALTVTQAPPPMSGGVTDWMSIVDAGGVPSEIDELLGISDDAARLLGKRTAELHLALAAAQANESFGAEPMTADDVHALSARVQKSAGEVFEDLKEALSDLPDEMVEQAGRLVRLRRRAMTLLQGVDKLSPDFDKIRIHGDYHLGQVLRAGADFVILDFEGEPSRPIAERGARQSPLRDVAGMLRSFAYAARAAMVTHVARHPGDAERLAPWAQLWERSVSGVFLAGYLKQAGDAGFLPRDRDSFTAMLSVYVLDKALYELQYELNNRPAWVHIPVAGLLTLLDGRGS